MSVLAKQMPLEFYTDTDDWDFTSKNTQYLTHGLHPYLASMIPQIPDKLFSMYAKPHTKIYDPFVGGGAVLVEAYLNNFSSTGTDVNPLAIILTKAKTTYIPEGILSKSLQLFIELYSSVEPELPAFPQMDFWFKSETIEQLARVKTAINELIKQEDSEYKDKLKTLFDCVFSNTVRDVSLTYRGEVRLRKLQGNDYDKFNPDAFAEFQKRFRPAIEKVSQLPRDNKTPTIIEGNARQLPFEDKQFDLVVTSPPYGDIKNTIPYHQFSKNMLYWLGCDDGVDKIRDNALGTKDKNKELPPSNTLQAAVDNMTKPNLIHEAVCFYADYLDALNEITRVTSERVVIVIGHRILDGTIVDNPAITTEFMQQIGWRLENRFNRSIKKKRLNRAMAFGNNAQGATIDTEAILVYCPS